MNLVEWLLFASGILLLVYFAIDTLYPFLERSIGLVASRRSEELKGDFLRISASRVISIFAAAGAFTGIAAYVAIEHPAVAIAGALVPVLLSGVLVRRYQKRRTRKVVSQLPTFLDAVSAFLKAGTSFPESLSSSIPLLPRGIREEISWLSRMHTLGTPLPEAFSAWEKRMPCPEMSLLARPIRIALSGGGNLVSLLDRTRDILRARQRQQDKLQAMTAQARLQAMVLTFLPPAFLLVLSRVMPGYLSSCTGTPAGIAILAAAALLQFMGWLLIRNILKARA